MGHNQILLAPYGEVNHTAGSGMLETIFSTDTIFPQISILFLGISRHILSSWVIKRNSSEETAVPIRSLMWWLEQSDRWHMCFTHSQSDVIIIDDCPIFHISPREYFFPCLISFLVCSASLWNFYFFNSLTSYCSLIPYPLFFCLLRSPV